MFAVIETGGKQFRVEQGDKLKVEKLPNNEGETIVFDQVLLIADDKNVEIGKPTLNKTVTAKVLSHGRGDKIIVFKFHSKKRYQKKQGHRQDYTEIEIVKIGDVAKKAVVAEKKEVKKSVTKKAEVVTKAPVKKAAAKKAPVKKVAAVKKPVAKKAPAKKKAE